MSPTTARLTSKGFSAIKERAVCQSAIKGRVLVLKACFASVCFSLIALHSEFCLVSRGHTIAQRAKKVWLFEVLWGKTLLSFLRSEESGSVSRDSELYLSEVKEIAQNGQQLNASYSPQYLKEPKVFVPR